MSHFVAVKHVSIESSKAAGVSRTAAPDAGQEDPCGGTSCHIQTLHRPVRRLAHGSFCVACIKKKPLERFA